MKNSRITLVFAFISTVTLAQEKLDIDTSSSTIRWFGEYAFYFGGHDGIIDFKEGYFLKNNDVISGGEFIIDMNSIQSLDMDKEEARTDLDNHLKNEDFFDVKKFPTAKLKITKVDYHDSTLMRIEANLTIKSITLPINFRAEADYDNEMMTARFKIDRTLWDITYNSKEVEGKLKDGLISDAIGFEVKLGL